MSHQNICRVALVVSSVLAALFIGEVGLRILDRPNPPLSGWKAINGSESEKNQLGFRGQPVNYTDKDFVIVLLGDSQVEAVACAYEWMPERRLEFHLNSNGRRVRVFSIGASGYGQDQQLLALREYLEKFRADLVVLWETPSNDIWNNLFPTHFPADGRPKPTFRLEGGQLRGPSEGIGQPLGEAPRMKLRLLWQRLSRWSRDGHWERTYPPAYRPLPCAGAAVKDDWQRWWEGNAKGMRDENLDNEKSHLAMFLTPRSERMQYGLDLTRRLLQEIELSIRSHGGQFTIFATKTPPTNESGHDDGIHTLRGKCYRTSEAQYYDNIDYVNKGFNFSSIPVTVERWAVGPDNPHLNEHATDQVMKDLAGRVGGLIPVAR